MPNDTRTRPEDGTPDTQEARYACWNDLRRRAADLAGDLQGAAKDAAALVQVVEYAYATNAESIPEGDNEQRDIAMVRRLHEHLTSYGIVECRGIPEDLAKFGGVIDDLEGLLP